MTVRFTEVPDHLQWFCKMDYADLNDAVVNTTGRGCAGGVRLTRSDMRILRRLRDARRDGNFVDDEPLPVSDGEDDSDDSMDVSDDPMADSDVSMETDVTTESSAAASGYDGGNEDNYESDSDMECDSEDDIKEEYEEPTVKEEYDEADVKQEIKEEKYDPQRAIIDSDPVAAMAAYNEAIRSRATLADDSDEDTDEV